MAQNGHRNHEIIWNWESSSISKDFIKISIWSWRQYWRIRNNSYSGTFSIEVGDIPSKEECVFAMVVISTALGEIRTKCPSVRHTPLYSCLVVKMIKLELLDATVRAGFPLDEKLFFIKSATGGGVKANQISHFLQGHTFKINYAAASLLSSQIIQTNFETYQETFSFGKQSEGVVNSQWKPRSGVIQSRWFGDKSTDGLPDGASTFCVTWYKWW